MFIKHTKKQLILSIFKIFYKISKNKEMTTHLRIATPTIDIEPSFLLHLIKLLYYFCQY